MKRGRSILGSVLDQKRSLLADAVQQNNYPNIIENLKKAPQRLQGFINSYRMALTKQDQEQIYKDFRKQQVKYKRFRQQLNAQFGSLQNQQSPQYNYVKTQLIHSIKNQMNLDLEMGKLIDQRRNQRNKQQLRWEKLQGRTSRVQNALDDIRQKTAQILQLQQSIKECLELLQIIGILVQQQGDKIQQVEDQVKEANFFISEAEKQIDLAKKRMQNATRKKCCVILIGVIAICLILIVLYGVSVVNV